LLYRHYTCQQIGVPYKYNWYKLKKHTSFLSYKQAFTGLLLLLSTVACKTASTPKQSVVATTIPDREETRVAFEGSLNEGMKYYILEDYPESIKSLEKAVSIYNGSGAAYYTLGKLYLTQKNLPKACAYSELATALDADNKYYAEQLGHIYEYQQAYPEATKVFKKLTTTHPEVADYYYDLAILYVYQNQFDDALKTYAILEQKFGKSLEITRQKQQIYLRSNKLDEAIKEGEDLITAFPDEDDYKVAHAEFLYTNGKYEAAIVLLKQVSNNTPGNPLAHLNLARVYKTQNNTEGYFQELKLAFESNALDLDTEINALSEFIKTASTSLSQDQALQLANLTALHFPREPRALGLLADLYLKMNRRNEALVQYKKVVQYGSGEYKNWIELLNLEYQTQHYDSLIADSDRALEVFPNQAAIWYYKGLGYYLKKDYAKAATALEQAAKRSSTQVEIRTMSLSLLGDTYNELKNYPKSDEAYEEVLKMDRNNEHVLNNYSYFLSLRKDKLEKAKELSERLMKKYTGNASYIDTYGWVLYQLKDYENAKKYLEVAVATKKDGTLLEHYGDVLYQLGDKENAMVMWKEAKKIGGASDLLDKKIAEGKMYE